MPAAVPGGGNHPSKEATALDKAGPGATAAATPSLDTADSPRPLRDPSAPRIEGSSIHGFYGQDAGKSFQTDTARADPGSPHAEELQSSPGVEGPGEGGRDPEKGIDPWLTVPIPCGFRSSRSPPSTMIFKLKIPLQQDGIDLKVFKTVEVVQQDGIDLKVDRQCLSAPDSMNGILIYTVQEAGLKCPCCSYDQQQWDNVHLQSRAVMQMTSK